MKMAIIAIVAILLLGGGGGAAYFFFMKPAEASGGEMAEHEKAEAEAKAAAEAEAHGEPEELHFVDLAPLVLPIIDESGVSQVVTIVVAIEVPTGDDAAMVKKLKPKLKDAYIQDMYGVLNRKAITTGGVIEVGKLKARLTRITKGIIGEEQVNDVLLQVVQQRPI